MHVTQTSFAGPVTFGDRTSVNVLSRFGHDVLYNIVLCPFKQLVRQHQECLQLQCAGHAM